MGPSGAQPGIPFPQASKVKPASRDDSVPRSLGGDSTSGHEQPSQDASDTKDMDVDSTDPGPAQRQPEQSTEATTLPSIKNLFGIERAGMFEVPLMLTRSLP